MTKKQFQPLLQQARQVFDDFHSAYVECYEFPTDDYGKRRIADANTKLEKTLWGIVSAILQTRHHGNMSMMEILDRKIEGGLLGKQVSHNWDMLELYIIKGSREKHTDPRFWKTLHLCWKQFLRILDHMKRLLRVRKQAITRSEIHMPIMTRIVRIQNAFHTPRASSENPYEVPSLGLQQGQAIRQSKRKQWQQQMRQLQQQAPMPMEWFGH